MKIIITESQFNLLIESSPISNDKEFRDTIKSFESTVTDSSGKHYVFDDKDPKTPKTFINDPKKKKGGTLTIGWGHTGSEAKIANKITNNKAESLLTTDINNEEKKTKTLFPKYDSYPMYVKRALVNSVYRGEAKKSYSWVQDINLGKWESGAENYLKGWNIDFSKAKDPRYRGGVADRMVKNQEAFKKYAKELKSGKKPTTEKPKQKPPTSIIGSNVYPKKTEDGEYANIRTEPQVNNGFINNIITTVEGPDLIGKVEKTQKDSEGNTWYYVKLDSDVSWWYDYGWVRSDVVKK